MENEKSLDETQDKEVCCPKFDPAPWDEKILDWHDKKFIKDKVFTLFYMPVNMGSVMKRLDEKVKKAGAELSSNLCLSDHTSNWNINVYVAVGKVVPDADNVTMKGKFLSKVYEGDYKDTGKWCKDFAEYAKEKGFKIKKWFMCYTTCPKCAQKYGHNYVVIIGKVE